MKLITHVCTTYVISYWLLGLFFAVWAPKLCQHQQGSFSTMRWTTSARLTSQTASVCLLHRTTSSGQVTLHYYIIILYTLVQTENTHKRASKPATLQVTDGYSIISLTDSIISLALTQTVRKWLLSTYHYKKGNGQCLQCVQQSFLTKATKWRWWSEDQEEQKSPPLLLR